MFLPFSRTKITSKKMWQYTSSPRTLPQAKRSKQTKNWENKLTQMYQYQHQIEDAREKGTNITARAARERHCKETSPRNDAETNQFLDGCREGKKPRHFYVNHEQKRNKRKEEIDQKDAWAKETTKKDGREIRQNDNRNVRTRQPE